MTSKHWMPLYIADYLADTAHLNAAQSGAYLHLIMHYWQTGGLPQNDDALARVARMTASEWAKNRSIIAAFFADGWEHKRIDAELAHAADVSSKRRASALLKHSNSAANAEQKDTHSHSQLTKEDFNRDDELKNGHHATAVLAEIQKASGKKAERSNYLWLTRTDTRFPKADGWWFAHYGTHIEDAAEYNGKSFRVPWEAVR